MGRAAAGRMGPLRLPSGGGGVTRAAEMITLTLRVEGEERITVNRAAYEAAKRTGEVDHFLDPYLSDLDGVNVVIEPDGTEYDPASERHGPTRRLRIVQPDEDGAA